MPERRFALEGQSGANERLATRQVRRPVVLGIVDSGVAGRRIEIEHMGASERLSHGAANAGKAEANHANVGEGTGAAGQRAGETASRRPPQRFRDGHHTFASGIESPGNGLRTAASWPENRASRS